MEENVVPLHPEGFPGGNTAAEFLAFFLGERREATAQAYVKDISYLRHFLRLETDADVVDFLLTSSPLHVNGVVQAWKLDMVSRSLSPNTIKRRLGTVRALLSEAGRMGLSSVRLSVRNVPLYRVKKTLSPARETVAQMVLLLSQDHSAWGARAEAIVRCAYELGLRRLEISRLDLRDVDLPHGRISVDGKCRRETLALTSTCSAAITRWLNYRGAWQGPLLVSLSSNSRGHRLSGTSVYRIVREAAERAGSPTPVPPHSLRRAAINEALGIADASETCVFSRHRDIRSLQEYVSQDSAQGRISEALAAGLETANGTGAPGDQGHGLE
jgi:integrase/recombinase XerC